VSGGIQRIALHCDYRYLCIGRDTFTITVELQTLERLRVFGIHDQHNADESIGTALCGCVRSNKTMKQQNNTTPQELGNNYLWIDCNRK
jgi:hypothetical protein